MLPRKQETLLKTSDHERILLGKLWDFFTIGLFGRSLLSISRRLKILTINRIALNEHSIKP